MNGFYYRILGKNRHIWPGAHPGKLPGSGEEFDRVVSFSRYPDARRLDIRSTIRDPFRDLHVKQFKQRSKVPVTVLIDGSSSMPVGNRTSIVTDFILSTLVSTRQARDSLKLFFCDDEVREISALQSTADELNQFFMRSMQEQIKPDALLVAGRRIHQKGSIVFIVSDYHLEQSFMQTLFRGLKNHWVVPVVLWTKDETEMPSWGISKILDAESSRLKTLFFTPTTKKRYQASWGDRKKILNQIFMRSSLPGFFISDEFIPDKMTEYFYKL